MDIKYLLGSYVKSVGKGSGENINCTEITGRQKGIENLSRKYRIVSGFPANIRSSRLESGKTFGKVNLGNVH